MNIYFPNVGRRCELVSLFKNSLPQLSPGLIWGSDPNPLAPALQIVDRCVNLPYPTDSSFSAHLIEFLKKESIDLIIPTIDPDLERFSSMKNEIKKYLPKLTILISPDEVIRMSADKRLTKEAFEEMGADVPAYITNTSKCNFPIFIKPALGSGSYGAKKINNLVELESALKITEFPMIEEFIEGDEITVDVLLDFNSNPLIAIPRKRILVRGGEVSRGIVMRDKGLESIAKDLASRLNCIGPVTIQFKNPEPNRWIAMEINARMGGGLPLSVAAGANWPIWIIQLALNEMPNLEDIAIIDELIISRADTSVFINPRLELNHDTSRIQLPPLVIFDMDDTLFPESEFVFSGYRSVAERVWEDYEIDILPTLLKLFNEGRRGDLMSIALLIHKIKVNKNYVKDTLVPAYRFHAPIIKPYLDVRSTISKLKKLGHKIALLSDGWHKVQQKKFDALCLNEFFDKVIFTDNLGKDAWKPSKIGFQILLEYFNLESHDAIYVGDNIEKDFIAPNALGMQSVRISRPNTEHYQKFSTEAIKNPTHEITSLSELN